MPGPPARPDGPDLLPLPLPRSADGEVDERRATSPEGHDAGKITGQVAG